MAVYTCYEMIADCRAGKDAGWEHLVTTYAPAVRRLLRHYAPARDTDDGIETYLNTLRADAGSPMRALDASSEREFLFELRDHLVSWANSGAAAGEPVEIDGFAAALKELTVVERQIVWFAVLGYDADTAAALMRVSPDTGRGVLERATALLAASAPAISIEDQAGALQTAVRSLDSEQEVGLPEYLHLIDGQLGWSSRKTVEKALAGSWREVDRLCRIREADAATRDTRPLTLAESAPLLRSLGIAPRRKSFWQKVFTS